MSSVDRDTAGLLWVVVRYGLGQEDRLVGHGLMRTRRVDERVLHPVTLGDDGDDGEDVAVLVDFGSLLGLETDGIGKGLVTGHLVRGDVHETHRLRGGDDGGDLVVHGQQFHLPDGLLSPQCKT